LHSNAVTLTYSFYDGSLLFNGAAPVTNATGIYNVPTFTFQGEVSGKDRGFIGQVLWTLAYECP